MEKCSNIKIVMFMKNKKIVSLVDAILKNSKDPKEYEKVYYKPKKGKNIIGFIFSLLFLIILIKIYGFKINTYYILLFLGDLIILIYYGLNLFTKNGFLLPKFVEKSSKSELKKEKNKE